MATRTITALFDTYAAAATAVSRLEASGIPHADISIVSNDPAHRSALEATDENTGTATGASLGTVLGGGAGLLAGLGMLAIPGLGPVVAAGWLASTLVGAGIGAAAGGVVGALTDAGVSHEDAHAYAEGINRGGTLVTVRTDESSRRRGRRHSRFGGHRRHGRPRFGLAVERLERHLRGVGSDRRRLASRHARDGAAHGQSVTLRLGGSTAAEPASTATASKPNSGGASRSDAPFTNPRRRVAPK